MKIKMSLPPTECVEFEIGYAKEMIRSLVEMARVTKDWSYNPLIIQWKIRLQTAQQNECKCKRCLENNIKREN